MKNASRKWYNYIFALILLGLVFCGSYLPYKFTNGEGWPLKYVCYCVFFSGVALLLVGFIIQDIYRALIRKKINDWDNKLDQKYIDKAWAIFYPMFVSGLISVVVGIFINLFLK